jgi:hypothetical protein
VVVERRDRRGRIMAGDPRYGPFCACGNLKGVQSRTCMDCYRESRRDDRYWELRTCPDCGGPKAPRAPGRKVRQGIRCLECAYERMRGVSVPGREQPRDHPFRRAQAREIAAIRAAA